ncbi:MAG: sigma-54-dependent Fis family transcriptional regulator [Nitrospinaceae bacterium]|nr:sigma-54-dependent Fis family transcriptional regulator [Nitrospinaceae bacterium]
MKRIGKETNIQALRKISSLFQTTSLEVDELLAMVMNAAKDIVGVKNGSLLLVQDEKTFKLQFYQAFGKNMGQLKDIDLPPGVGISGHVAKTGETIISNDVAKDPRWYQGVSEKMRIPVQSMASFPLIIDKKVIGVVQFLDKVDGTTFDEKNVETLQSFANLMAKFFQVSKNRKLLGEEFGRLKEQYLLRYTIVGESKAIQKCIAMAEKVADSKASVLLTGESGTGKELFAHLVHDRSQRQNKPFVSVSCGALPASILERELFGHEKGAFTGADSQKIGLFEAANTGTLFLDEIGEMPLDMQVKLLRVIQEESFIRLGGTETIKVDVRLITATNLNLDKEVQEGNFRQDLFYRINVIKITLPPLREKLEDIPDLLTFFIKKHSPENQPIKKPGKGLISHLMSYAWPGNIRELENSVERSIVLTDDDELLPEAFPFETSQAPIELNVGSTLKQASDLFRRTFISNTLKSTSGNRTKAAQILDVQRSYLSRLIKELEIK